MSVKEYARCLIMNAAETYSDKKIRAGDFNCVLTSISSAGRNDYPDRSARDFYKLATVEKSVSKTPKIYSIDKCMYALASIGSEAIYAIALVQSHCYTVYK